MRLETSSEVFWDLFACKNLWDPLASVALVSHSPVVEVWFGDWLSAQLLWLQALSSSCILLVFCILLQLEREIRRKAIG